MFTFCIMQLLLENDFQVWGGVLSSSFLLTRIVCLGSYLVVIAIVYEKPITLPTFKNCCFKNSKLF